MPFSIICKNIKIEFEKYEMKNNLKRTELLEISKNVFLYHDLLLHNYFHCLKEIIILIIFSFPKYFVETVAEYLLNISNKSSLFKKISGLVLQ